MMKDRLSWRDLKVAEKSATAGLRTAKQSESRTDHLTLQPGPHSLRCSGSRGQSWGENWGWQEGLRSSAPRVKEGMSWHREPGRKSGPVGEAR